MAKFLTEFLGTFFLVLTIGLAGGPQATARAGDDSSRDITQSQVDSRPARGACSSRS